jgi:hypothetical protein
MDAGLTEGFLKRIRDSCGFAKPLQFLLGNLGLSFTEAFANGLGDLMQN